MGFSMEKEVFKKGQVTLFIIVGILLVLALALIVVFREEITLAQILPESLYPTETGTIKRYIEGCAENTAREGLGILGAQGGYIWLPWTIEANPLSYIDTGLKVPLWQYYSENRIPSTELIQAQLSRYLSENMPSCINSLDAFKAQYDVVEKGAIVTETKLTDELVRFSITYPIEIISKDGVKITDLEQFSIDLPIKLKQIMEVARAVMETEAKQMKFEKTAIDLLALDPEIPLVGVEVGCGKKVWEKAKIENKIKTLLQTNLPSIRTEKTDYVPIPQDEPYVLNHYIWQVTEQSYEDIGAAFTFIDKGFRMNVRPGTGRLLKSGETRGADIASYLCIQQWNFVYDMEFPVMVTIEDKASNYALNYGFLVNVVNNAGRRMPLSQAIAINFETGDETSYCNNIYGDYNTKIYSFDNVSDPVYYTASEPIAGVNISFTCLKYTCSVGRTKFVDSGARAVLEKQLPYCVNGVINAKKEGYKESKIFFTTVQNGEANVYLTPVKYLNYSVKKHILENEQPGGARNLDSNENVFISLKYFFNGTQMHESYGGLPSDKGEIKPIELLAEGDYTYLLEVYIMDDNTFVGGFKGNWTPKWNDIKNGKEIVFHTAAAEDRSDSTMIDFMSKLEDYSAQLEHEVR